MRAIRGAAVAALLFAFAAGEAAAQTCQAAQAKDPNIVCRLGTNRAARFYEARVATPADVVTMLEKKRNSVIALLGRAPLPRPVSGSDAEALYGALLEAAKAGPIGQVRVGVADGHAAEFPFMALRNLRTGKDDLKTPVAGASALRWGGAKEGFEAFVVKAAWGGQNWALYVPKLCGNFWLEGVRIQEEAKVAPRVTLKAGEACFGLPVPLQIETRDAVRGELTVDGKTTTWTDPGSLPRSLPGLSRGPHSVSVKAISKDGLEDVKTATATARECRPSCDGLTVTPASVRRGKTVEVAARASVHPDYGAGQRISRIVVTASGPAPAQVTIDGGEGKRSFEPAAVGDYTYSAVATDSLGQESAPCSSATGGVARRAFLPFVAVFAGKERAEREEGGIVASRCAAIAGVKGGFLFALGDRSDLELAVGGKLDLEDSGNSSIFLDAALQRHLGRGFVGAGVSAWDLTLDDSRALGALVQGGVGLDHRGRFQLVVEGRVPFDQFGEIDNHYQVWGGFRFRPAGR